MDTKKPRMKKEQQQYLLNFLMRNSETVNRTPQPIVDVLDPHVKQNIVMVLDDTQLPKPKQTLILDAVTVDIHSDTEEEPPKEAAMVDALTPTASHDGATVVTSMATDASSIPTASRVGRIAVDALMMPAANRDLATIGCSREREQNVNASSNAPYARAASRFSHPARRCHDSGFKGGSPSADGARQCANRGRLVSWRLHNACRYHVRRSDQ
ncbi:unnamed protein product [Parnassius apollo]|uniref:(apollo) hypothetical protein n=1 Tax=Parnassius apollo TaxID=110799 RepID=A0A8S3X3C5_PARAO|nr:unnamed protein product [Parnassius apollo]